MQEDYKIGKPKAPPPPDYVGAANAQGAANVEAARATSKLSNPNIYNAYGQRIVTYDPNDPDRPTVTESLSPVGQQLFDQDNRISVGLGNLAEGGIDRVGSILGTQFDMSKIPGQAKAGMEGWNNAYNAIMQRNIPEMDRQRNAMENKLSNQGIFRGSEGYGNAQREIAQRENDFALGAQQQATGQQQAQFGMDTQARQDAIAQEAYLRQLPLNEINALRSGAVVNVPQFQGFQGSNVQAAPILQGVQAQDQANMNRYQTKAAGYNNMMSGLFSLGSAGLGMFG